MGFLERGSAHLFYQDSGGEGAAIVFSHGILMDQEMFEPQVRSLAGEFRCISWDQRGHGQSDQEGSWSYWDSAEDLLALLDHLELDHAFLVGMSQGGFLSLRAALLAPERVQGLGLIDTQAGPENPDIVPVYEGLLEAWRAGPSVELAGSVADIILGPADHSPWVGKWLARPHDWVEEPFKTLVGREDIHDRLDEIACPALVIHGEADAAISMDIAERLCSGLPRCEGLVRIEGAGHAANLSHPGVVTEALRDFTRRHTT
ncbi:MAG: 3-oxoadipate enol-lactonase [Actinomycetota bacterium]|jgi:pimeloyl-ACP methyl ester carboxylesterase|nr:3-oxoadipate enol-lactonase [Actinomycetota bacterium]